MFMYLANKKSQYQAADDIGTLVFLMSVFDLTSVFSLKQRLARSRCLQSRFLFLSTFCIQC